MGRLYELMLDTHDNQDFAIKASVSICPSDMQYVKKLEEYDFEFLYDLLLSHFVQQMESILHSLAISSR